MGGDVWRASVSTLKLCVFVGLLVSQGERKRARGVDSIRGLSMN